LQHCGSHRGAYYAQLSWLNRICAIAAGSVAANARTIDVFQVL